MLALLTGSSLGLAIGWLAYLHRDSLLKNLFLYAAPVTIVVYRVVVLPFATASGAMDMGFFEFVQYAAEYYLGDYLSVMLSWMMLGLVIAQVAALIGYRGFTPIAPEPETREQARRRVRASMKYSDDYFD